MPTFVYVVLGLIIFCVVALLLTPNLFRPSAEAQRIFDVVKNQEIERTDRRTIRGKEKMRDKVLFIASELRIRLGLADNPKLKARLAAAGMHRNASLDIFFAAQFLVPLAGAVTRHCAGSGGVRSAGPPTKLLVKPWTMGTPRASGQLRSMTNL